jgi:hypothetical protein
VAYKNKQLMEKIIFENSFRYHTKKEGYPNLSSDINKLGAISGQKHYKIQLLIVSKLKGEDL